MRQLNSAIYHGLSMSDSGPTPWAVDMPERITYGKLSKHDDYIAAVIEQF